MIQEIKRRVEKSGDMPAYQCGLSLTTDSTGSSVSAEVIYFEEGVSFADAASATSWSELMMKIPYIRLTRSGRMEYWLMKQ